MASFVFPTKKPPRKKRTDAAAALRPSTANSRRPPTHAVVLPQMSNLLDSLGAHRRCWKKSLSRFESEPLLASSQKSVRPSTAIPRKVRCKSRCSSRVTQSEASAIGKEVGAESEALDSKISELTERIRAFDDVLGKPTTPRRLVKVRCRTALSRPPNRSVMAQADAGMRHDRSHLGRSMTAVVGHGKLAKRQATDKQQNIQLLAARIQRGGCSSIRINKQSITTATRSFHRLCRAGKGCTGRADFNTFDCVMKTIGLEDVYLNDKIFKAMDKKGVCSVGYTEMTLGLAAMWNNCLSNKIRMYFQLLDIDGNGTIDQEEIERVVEDSGKYSSQKQAGDTAKLIFKELAMEGGIGISHDELMLRVLDNPAVLKIFEHVFN